MNYIFVLLLNSGIKLSCIHHDVLGPSNQLLRPKKRGMSAGSKISIKNAAVYPRFSLLSAIKGGNDHMRDLRCTHSARSSPQNASSCC